MNAHAHAQEGLERNEKEAINDRGSCKTEHLWEQREDESQETGSVDGGNERREKRGGGKTDKYAEALFPF